MNAADFVQVLALSLGLTALGCVFCFWLMKKAGIGTGGLGYYKKLFYDNCTGSRDSRTGRRSYYQSKKGGKLSIEITCTRGTLSMEFCTEDGQVLQSWRNGLPEAFTVELPPRTKVYWRTNMNHFSGTIIFR